MWKLTVFLLSLAPLAAAGPDSDALLRAARQERVRRARILRPAVVHRIQGIPKAGSQAPAAGVKPAAGAPAAAVTHDETWWRERLGAADRSIRGLEGDLDWARQRLYIAQNDLIVPLDAKREFNRKAEHDQLLAEISRLAAEIQAARGEPARIREEARREGVPPGWLR